MTYATKQNMIDRFGETEIRQLTDRSKSGAIDDIVLLKALDDADAQINAYLSTVYSLPLTTTPSILERIACDLARYQLWDIRASDNVKERYNAAITFLQNVAKGTANLGIDSSNQPQTPSGGVRSTPPDRVFTNNTLADY